MASANSPSILISSKLYLLIKIFVQKTLPLVQFCKLPTPVLTEIFLLTAGDTGFGEMWAGISLGTVLAPAAPLSQLSPSAALLPLCSHQPNPNQGTAQLKNNCSFSQVVFQRNQFPDLAHHWNDQTGGRGGGYLSQFKHHSCRRLKPQVVRANSCMTQRP